MKKLFLIGLKDVKLAFRDRAALILMLLAPFLLTLGLGFVTGVFRAAPPAEISHIPVILVNQDGKQLGNALVEAFQSKDLNGLWTRPFRAIWRPPISRWMITRRSPSSLSLPASPIVSSPES